MDHPGTQTACSLTDTETTKKESWALLMRSPKKKKKKKKVPRQSPESCKFLSASKCRKKYIIIIVLSLRASSGVFFFTCPSTSRESWVSYYQRQLSSALQCGRVTWNTWEREKKEACVQNRAISLQLSPQHRHTLGLHKDKLSTSAGKNTHETFKEKQNKKTTQHKHSTAQHYSHRLNLTPLTFYFIFHW